jgi:hypothetical protein
MAATENKTEEIEVRVIECKDLRYKGILAFWREVQEAILDGWVVWEDAPLRRSASLGHYTEVPLVRGEAIQPKVVETPLEEVIPEVVTPEEVIPEEVIVEEETPEEVVPEEVAEVAPPSIDYTALLTELAGITKKAPLFEFATRAEIVVPEEHTVASAIKKYLKGQLEDH